MSAPRFILFSVIAVVMGAFFLRACSFFKTSEYPLMETTTIEGQPYNLVAHRGHWVLVNFWATWCGPCRQEIPELSKLHGRNGVEVVGIASENIQAAEMREFLKVNPVTYPIAIARGRVGGFAPPTVFPMSYLIDPTGKVVETFRGGVNVRLVEDKIASTGGAVAKQ